MTQEIDKESFNEFMVKYQVKEFNLEQMPLMESIRFSAMDYHQQYCNTHQIPVVRMMLPLESVKRLVKLDNRFDLPRHCHPAVREAHNQYLFIKAMVDDGYPI